MKKPNQPNQATQPAQPTRATANRVGLSIAALVAVASLSGCGSTPGDKEFKDAFYKGDYPGAYKIATDAAGGESGFAKKENLHWQLHRGGLALMMDRAQLPNGAQTAASDLGNKTGAEASFRLYDNASKAQTAASYAASILVNDTALTYSGKMFERIMAVTYSAIADLEVRGLDAATSSFNAIEDWTQLAEVRFAEERAKEAALEGKADKSMFDDAKRSGFKIVRELQYNPTRADGDSGFVNTYAIYLTGLIRLLSENPEVRETAQNYLRPLSKDHLKEKNLQVRRDLALATPPQDSRAPAPVTGRVWVVVENGLCSELVQVKDTTTFRIPTSTIATAIAKNTSKAAAVAKANPKAAAVADGADIAAAVISDMLNKPVKATLAFPKLVPRGPNAIPGKKADGSYDFSKSVAPPPAPNSEPSYFTIGANGKYYATEVVCDMDKIARAEYEKTFDWMVNREVTRCVVRTTAIVAAKVAAQVAAKIASDAAAKKMANSPASGAFSRFGGGVAMQQVADKAVSALGDLADANLAIADTRQWATLPKNIQILSLPIPADREISIGGLTGRQTVKIPDCKNAIVFFRVPGKVEAAPAPRVIAFK